MQRITPSRTAALVASAKDEGIYILEWLAHHRAVGFEHVFIYTNNNRDGSDALYALLAHHGLITVLENQVRAAVSPQVKAYEHSLLHLPELRDFEWVGYFDIDELLVPSADHDHSVLELTWAAKAAHPDTLPGAIYFNWRWYGSSGRVAFEAGLMQDQFVFAKPHPLVKSLVRLPDVRSMRFIHVPELVEGAGPGVTSALRTAAITDQFTLQPEYGGGQLNHYYQKSFAEFCVKRDRGEGSAIGGAFGKAMDTFFLWDVQQSPATASPMPPVLRTRVGAELATLRSLPGMEALEQEIQNRHRELQAAVIGDDVFVEYGRLKQAVRGGAVPPTTLLGLPDIAPTGAEICMPDLPGEHYSIVLHRLHAVLQPQSYLEIGTADGSSLALAQCASIAVDPHFHLGDRLPSLLDRPSIAFYAAASDDFFARHNPAVLLGSPVEMAFLDGMHHCEVLLRDFINTERSCRRGSLVIMHDCLPVEASIATRVPGQQPPLQPHREGWWCGDVWRTVLLLKRRRPDLNIVVLDANPTGLAIVTELSPDCMVLADAYESCVAEMMSWELQQIGLNNLFAELDVRPTASLSVPDQIGAQYRLRSP